MSIDTTKLIEEFKRIKNIGFIKNVKPNHHDGSAGNTFESCLGVKENNLKDPDFLGFEIKTKKKKSSSWISLFTLKPDNPENGDNYMRNNWGIVDEEYPQFKCFRTSLYAHRWSIVYNKCKMKISNSKENKRVGLVMADLNENIIDENVFWKYKSITAGVKKLKNTFIIVSIPMLTSIIWYLCGKMNQSMNIFTILDPMYPGILISLILYLININHQHHHKAL